MSLMLLIWAGVTPGAAQAQWPPLTLRLVPVHEGDRITYRITQLASQVDWVVSDVYIKVSLPQGLRFVEAVADPPVQASFDGQEVSFFLLNLNSPLKNAYFVVEITDPSQTVVTLQPWLSWEGEVPGSYSQEPITIDITQPAQFLDWAGPSRTTVQLEMSVTAANQVLTYKIYPQKIRRIRVWDLKINLPLPEGTTFLSAEAPPTFESHFDGREVQFFALEMPAETIIEPLIVNLSAEGIITPALTTRAWASWKNAGRQAGLTISAEEQTVTGDLVIQPQAAQYTLSDQAGDVPFADYDLTNISLQSSETNLEVAFHTAGPLCGTDQPLEFRLFIDADCQAQTGQARQALGVDYEIRYDLASDSSQVRVWQADQADWIPVEAATTSFVGRQSVIVQVPFSALSNHRQFCWAGRSKNQSTHFVPYLPDDWLPNSNDARLTQYRPATPAPPALVSLADQVAPETAATTPWAACPSRASQAAAPAVPVATEPGGSIAVPLADGSGSYNIHLFSVPEGKEITQIANAHQPNFWSDGQKLLFRRPEDNGGIYEYDLTARTEELVTERLNQQHPFYEPGGNRLVYDNRELVSGADGNQYAFLFTQCSLLPPHPETEQRCQDILRFGLLAPAGQREEIEDSYPVWTATDRIAYRGCNAWTGFGQCGIYTVPSLSTQRASEGLTPTPLTDDPTDTPSDTQGDFIVFSSQRDGNWEAYLLKLDGSGLLNLSNSPDSQDGLPTLSPDGRWVAFLSNRTDQWAIWATSLDSHQTRHLFDLPPGLQVGLDDQGWLNERLDWGP
jgi:hypothetical protein